MNLLVRNLKVEYQKSLEEKYAKNHKLKSVISKYKDDEFFNSIGIDPSFGAFVLAQLYLLKRANYETMFNILFNKYKDLEGSIAQLEVMVQEGLVEEDEELGLYIMALDLTEAESREISTYQYPLPMIVKPIKVTSNRETGYLTLKDSLILKKGNHIERDINLDHINKVNSIPLSLNKVVVNNLRANRSNIKEMKEGETPEEYKERQKQYKDYLDSISKTISILKSYTDEFYITNKYDKRGRVYRQGYHLSPQGTDWHKAVLEFSNKEYLNEE